MKKKLVTTLALVALGSAGLVAAAPNSGATTGVKTLGACADSGAFYLYEWPHYGTSVAKFKCDDRDLRNNKYSGSGDDVNDHTKSMKNKTPNRVYIYQKVGCQGAVYTAKPNSEDKDLYHNSNNPKMTGGSCVLFGGSN
ncbi:peptidase inhibitor family I36 protein [Streptomyces sioyaensis]|uniref:peptidase inhibitor family I36 protein n=1 Tax=Streptomyces sioyaensis TaxID=67364 RepID=UPI003D70CC74